MTYDEFREDLRKWFSKDDPQGGWKRIGTDGSVLGPCARDDKDGDGDLWETTDTFSLDKIKILDDSVDYMAQDADATSSYYFKVTPVKYSGGAWTFDTGHTVTVTNTTDYNAYLDLSSNTDFDNINYALIETESALISEVVVSA